MNSANCLKGMQVEAIMGMDREDQRVFDVHVPGLVTGVFN